MKTQDVNCRAVVALPAANANVDTDVIDLRTNGAPIGSIPGLGLLIMFSAALAALVDAKHVTVELFHCATADGQFAKIPAHGNFDVVGADGAGASIITGMPGLEIEVPLPRHTLGFIKANVAVDNGGGDNTAITLTLAGRI